MVFKKGNKIIWDSHFGYEIGYFIEDSHNQMYGSYKIDLTTGVVQGESLRPSSEVIPYDDKMINEMIKKYGYEKQFKD